jgi:nucleoside-diphosphate-sugar epimerase
MLDGSRILVTGPTGMVATLVTLALAEHNEVIAIARFNDPDVRSRFEEAGVICLPTDLATGDLSGVPTEIDHVVNFAVAKSGWWDHDLRVNAVAAGLLLAHCRRARSFLHCSSTAVYQHAGTHRLAEDDPLGDNHRAIMPTYSITKIAAEAVVRTACQEHGVPTTIARLNVPYGDRDGWPAFHLEMLLAGEPVPVHPDRPNLFNPIHTDDIIATVPRLLEIASVPATIVNWAGDEQVALEDWVAHLAELASVSLDPLVVETDQTIGGVTVDLTRMHELVGHTTVPWRDGLRRMVAAMHPELLDR